MQCRLECSSSGLSLEAQIWWSNINVGVIDYFGDIVQRLYSGLYGEVKH